MVSSKTASKTGTKQSTGGLTSSSALTDLSNPSFALPFFHYLTIPKSTTQADPLVYVMSLPIGRINRLWVEFPKGCSGLAGIQVFRSLYQIFPLPEGVWLRSDNSVMNFAFTHAIAVEPYEVTLKGYNIDDTYPHTIWIGFEMSGFDNELTENMKAFMKTLTGK